MLAEPTPFPQLNALLREYVARVRMILGDNFFGAYLQGSFALGAGDMDSDVDVLVALRGPATAQQVTGLRELHRELPARTREHWTQHLEGSYPLLDDLRTLDGLGAEWMYVDHGATEIEQSTHCNREATRWILREHGIALAGPAPKSFMEPLDPDALRSAARADISHYLEDDLLTWISFDIAWAQRYAVITLARMLYTAEFGEVASKPRALTWMRDELDAPRWATLAQQVIDDRPRGFDREDPPRPGSVEATLAFDEYVRARAARQHQ